MLTDSSRNSGLPSIAGNLLVHAAYERVSGIMFDILEPEEAFSPMLAFKDFGLQKTVTTGSFIKTASVIAVPFETALQEANAWLEEERENVRLLSVETVQLADLHPFIRVWYTRSSSPRYQSDQSLPVA